MDDSTFGSTGSVRGQDYTWTTVGPKIDRYAPEFLHVIGQTLAAIENGTSVPNGCLLTLDNNKLSVGAMTAGIGGFGERTG